MHWNAEAARLANGVKAVFPSMVCGAMPWRGPDLTLAFGNDDFAHDERARRQVKWLRETLPHHGADVLGFGLCDDGHTWVLIVRTPRVEWLHAVVHRAWGEANPLEHDAWRRSPLVLPGTRSLNLDPLEV
jgi:hypothetical protein